MRKLIYILPFLLILALLANALRILAFVAGQPYLPYNADLEGARILKRDLSILQGRIPTAYDILFAGTSRTEADYDASAIAAVLGERCGLKQRPSAYNLGKVADSYQIFADRIRQTGLPRLLVLEFSPHVMLRETNSPTAEVEPPPLGYQTYKTKLMVTETYFSGVVQGALGLDDLIHMPLGQLALIIGALRQEHDRRLARLYYMLRNAQGFGLRMTDSGQVHYRTYLPDRNAAELIGEVGAEYPHYVELLAKPPNPDNWQSLETLLDLFGGGRQVVVVRPPVNPTMYAFENEKQAAVIAQTTEFLRRRGVAYIDLNAGDYHSTDWSHIDWYDTERVSRDLADHLTPAIHPGVFSGSPGCRTP